jgi:hypothetical protein
MKVSVVNKADPDLWYLRWNGSRATYRTSVRALSLAFLKFLTLSVFDIIEFEQFILSRDSFEGVNQIAFENAFSTIRTFTDFLRVRFGEKFHGVPIEMVIPSKKYWK